MDHRDDVTLYQTLREANASARADTYARGKSVLRFLGAVGRWVVRHTVKGAQDRAPKSD